MGGERIERNRERGQVGDAKKGSDYQAQRMRLLGKF